MEKNIETYSGTTLENFRTCAFIAGKRVLFDKRMESRCYHHDFFSTPSFNQAVDFGYQTARKLNNNILILETRLPINKHRFGPEEEIVINGVWMLRNNKNTDVLKGVSTEGDLREYFERLNPIEVLE